MLLAIANSPLLTRQQIQDIGRAADDFTARGRQLVDISKAEFQLGSHLTELLQKTRSDLIDGKGFTLFKGFPTTKEWDVEKVAIAYMGAYMMKEDLAMMSLTRRFGCPRRVQVSDPTSAPSCPRTGRVGLLPLGVVLSKPESELTIGHICKRAHPRTCQRSWE